MMSSQSKALLIILLITPLFGLGVDLYSPSLPAIAKYFNIQESSIKLTMILYVVGYGFGQVFFGPISDRIGRKKTLIMGLFFYFLTSILLCITNSLDVFMSGRFAQGFLISSAGVINKALLSDNFKNSELEKATAYMVIIWAVSPIIAPVIGSYMQIYLSWRAGFVFLSIYGFLAMLLTRLLLSDARVSLSNSRLKEVVMDYTEIFHDKKFIGYSIILAITYAMLMVFSIAAPFITQVYLKNSVIFYGNFALLMGVSFFVGTMANRFLINYFPADSLINKGLCFTTVVAIFMVVWNMLAGISIFSLGVPVFLMIFFSAIVTPNCYAMSLKIFVKKAGTATAVRGVLTLIGAAIFSSPVLFIDSSSHPELIALEYLALGIFALMIFYFMVMVRKKIHCGHIDRG